MVQIKKNIRLKNNIAELEGIGYCESPIGIIRVCSNSEGICALNFVDFKASKENLNITVTEAIKQIREYFNGQRLEFDLPISVTGTEYQTRVWEALSTIKYGETATYKDIAKLVGNEKASRAIGGANNKNPVAIILPCHRIIGSNGKLVGYAGGLDKKQWLLDHEKKNK